MNKKIQNKKYMYKVENYRRRNEEMRRKIRNRGKQIRKDCGKDDEIGRKRLIETKILKTCEKWGLKGMELREEVAKETEEKKEKNRI